MLDIYLIDEEDPITCALELAELLRTVRVVAEVPFIEPSTGHLINLTAVTRLVELDEAELSRSYTPNEVRGSGSYGPGQPRRRPPGGSAPWCEG